MNTQTAARVWVSMRALVLEKNDRQREVCTALGMSFIKIKALRRVVKGPLTMRELTEQLVTDKPYTTLVVDDLERRGLVARSVHPDDRRCKIVTATPEGVEAAAKAGKILNEPPATILGLDDEDLAALDKIVAKMAGG
jgi:DNA-binding MarR family transcriptional regulator